MNHQSYSDPRNEVSCAFVKVRAKYSFIFPFKMDHSFFHRREIIGKIRAQKRAAEASLVLMAASEGDANSWRDHAEGNVKSDEVRRVLLDHPGRTGLLFDDISPDKSDAWRAFVRGTHTQEQVEAMSLAAKECIEMNQGVPDDGSDSGSSSYSDYSDSSSISEDDCERVERVKSKRKRSEMSDGDVETEGESEGESEEGSESDDD